MRCRFINRARLSRRSGVIGVITVILMSLMGACSSSPSAKATLVASKTRIGPGDSVTLRGALSTRRAGLNVQLESGAGTAFTTTGDATATDGSGSYTFIFKPTEAGAVELRVEVIDGKKKTASPSVQVTVLAATSLTAALGEAAEVALGGKATVSGRVTPASSGRTVTLETSSDGATWTPTASTASTDGTGNFTLRVPTQGAGAVVLRITVAATTSQAEGRSTAVHLYVADYKTAGTKYVACVKDGNASLSKERAASVSYDAGQITLAKLQTTDAAVTVALRAQITCFHDYVWPPSAADLVADLEAQDAVAADTAAHASKAADIDAYNLAYNDPTFAASFAVAGADAAKIRRILGLPARPTT